MSLSMWHIWVIAGLVLLIIEIFTPGFIVGVFGIACFAAALGAAYGLAFDLQLLVFGIVLDHTLASRDTINNRLRINLDEATDKWGVKINRVELQDIMPPDDIKVTMEKQMRAERDRRAMILEAEGLKQARILESEGIQQAEINKAEGLKQALILKATGEAEARIRVAEAEAEAVAKVTKVVKESGGDPTAYLIALKYIDALREMVSGKDNKVVYLPYEATAVLGSLGSIKEIFKSGKS